MARTAKSKAAEAGKSGDAPVKVIDIDNFIRVRDSVSHFSLLLYLRVLLLCVSTSHPLHVSPRLSHIVLLPPPAGFPHAITSDQNTRSPFTPRTASALPLPAIAIPDYHQCSHIMLPHHHPQVSNCHTPKSRVKHFPRCRVAIDASLR